jgi:hypothetical protein
MFSRCFLASDANTWNGLCSPWGNDRPGNVFIGDVRIGTGLGLLMFIS